MSERKGSAAFSGCAALLIAFAGVATADDMHFGLDSHELALNGTCDDRRFAGPGMGQVLDWRVTGFDATDCRAAFAAGQVRLWSLPDAVAATDCTAVDMGDDKGTAPDDGFCDDPRFEGLSTGLRLLPANIGHDTSDCTRLCAYGLIGLRD
jgi:hypothetical protein